MEKCHKSEIAILFSTQLYTQQPLCIAFYFKTVHSRSLQTFAGFDRKQRNMTSLKRHFHKNFWIFPEILVEDVTLMPNKVLKLSPISPNLLFSLQWRSKQPNKRSLVFLTPSTLTNPRDPIKFLHNYLKCAHCLLLIRSRSSSTNRFHLAGSQLLGKKPTLLLF